MSTEPQPHSENPPTSSSPPSTATPDEIKAAGIIQKYVRGHQTRTANRESGLSSAGRWGDAMNQSKWIRNERDAEEGKNTPKERWHRALHAASQIQNGSGIDQDTAASSTPGEPKEKGDLAIKNKKLEEQHWLEMCDSRHRYGSNLKYYHAKWEESDTRDNFFRWLDRGPGKELSLPECSREQLEKERITYLSAEQRLNYLVTISREDGKLRWFGGALAGQFVDTAPKSYEDAGQGRGIVPLMNVPKEDDEQDIPEPGSGSSSESSSDEEEEDAHHYADTQEKEQGLVGRFFSKLSVNGLTERMLRKTVRKNTWIYVADMDGNLFVGLKKTGTFQHSSFLSGGRVTSAGILTVQHGLIRSLSPLSGHYRSNIEHFKSFLHQLEGQGADLSKVKVKKAELILLGLEKYAAFSKKEAKVKTKILHPQKAKRDERAAAEEERDNKKNSHPDSATGPVKSNSQTMAEWKRDLFYGRRGGTRDTSSVAGVREFGKGNRVSEEERKEKVETDGQSKDRAERADETKGDRKDLNGPRLGKVVV